MSEICALLLPASRVIARSGNLPHRKGAKTMWPWAIAQGNRWEPSSRLEGSFLISVYVTGIIGDPIMWIVMCQICHTTIGEPVLNIDDLNPIVAEHRLTHPEITQK
jgi:hypothetical protein